MLKKKNNFILILLALIVLLLAACSKEKQAGGSTEAENSIAIEDKTVAGVTQKGPLIKGSAVKVYELDEVSLTQTGSSFKGQVVSDDGNFSVEHINLKSGYVLLEATGPYYSELTGSISNMSITLNAFANVSDRENVNINLLTHLEYDRVLWLIHNEDMSVSAAKKQADSEIFMEFASEKTKKSPEDLNIFEEGDENAILLAISVLMQLGKSESEFVLALADFVNDIKVDGVWDDQEKKTRIADVAFESDMGMVRTNIESWNVASTIPNFEKYVEEFWNFEFGLGNCTKETEDSVELNSNEKSSYYRREFVCRDGHWKLYDAQKFEYPEILLTSVKNLDCSSSMYCPRNCQNVTDETLGRNCSRVMTELDDGSDSYGFFSMGNDKSSGFIWPAGDKGYGEEAASRDKYGYLYGIATVGNEKNPYAYVGFNVSGVEKQGNDLTDWKGLCFAYIATEDFFVTIATPMGEKYMAKLPSSTDLVVADATWDKFVAEEFSEEKRSAAVKNVNVIDFRFTVPGSRTSFKIYAIGKAGTCHRNF